MNLARALTIPGWMTEVELSWLAVQAGIRKRIVEIGSWKGRSTRALADNLILDGMIVAVDTWEGSDEDGHRNELSAHPNGWLFEEFKRNLSGIRSLSLQPLQMTSLEAARVLQGGLFDMIFVDASHDYENVKADILAWKPLLANGGILCGHDYQHQPVVYAVTECVPGHRVGAETIWCWEKV